MYRCAAGLRRIVGLLPFNLLPLALLGCNVCVPSSIWGGLLSACSGPVSLRS